MKLRLVASLLDEPDRSDPENKTVVVGLKLQEIWDGPRRTVLDPVSVNEDGSTTQTIHQVREDGKEDFVWGCRVDIARNGPPEFSSRSPLERAVAALAKMLLTDPPPPEVLAVLAEAEIGVEDGHWSGWWDLHKPDQGDYKSI